jgi:transposase-like protein
MSQCTCDGCERPSLQLGLCSKHYQRYRRNGTTDLKPRVYAPVEERFWLKVNKRADDECWVWMGAKGNHGYGRTTKDGAIVLAYHGAVVMHTCDNRLCVNPAHLKLGTQADNMKDMDAKGRRVPHGVKGEKHHAAILTDAQRAAIVADKRGHSAVAREYGVSPQVVFYVRKAAGEDTPAYKSEAQRSANPNVRLTPDDIRAIRADTRKPRFVAADYGIIPDYVTMIRKRKVWKHVE